MEKHITLPLTEELAKTLHAGDTVYLTGTIYTSRDAGHKRMCEALARGEKIPFDPTDATIYYVGPTPAKPGQVIGSAGPTTSGRMDAYAPTMMSVGARGMIGKGARLPEVVEAMKKYHGVYFGAIGGAGALLAKCIKKAELIAYEDLGAESDDKMVKEYLKEKADSLTAEKERLTAQKERLDGIRERLHKSIDEVQKKEDVDFEIFSPRADMRVSKEMLNEMHQQMNDVKRQQAQTARELEEVTAKLDKFLYMLEEVQNLPD